MKRTVMLTALLGLMALASPAFAGITLDFGTGNAGTGGTYTLIGSNATGANIPIETLTVSGTAFDGVYEVEGTATGSNNGANGCKGGASVGCGSLNFDTRSGTNFVSITGFIPGLGINVSELLLTGTISSFTASSNGLLNATGPDTKAANLLAALGIPGTQFTFFGFSLTTNGQSPDTVISTDIRNTSVPEPSSIALFGTVLFGCCALLRRRMAVSRSNS